METIHLRLRAACSDGSSGNYDFTSEKQSLMEYAIRRCRKHKLISERVTLLAFQDQLQVVQLSMAHQNKKRGEKFEADRKLVIQQTLWINSEKVESLLEAVNCTTAATNHLHRPDLNKEVLQEYTAFMKSSNHVDTVDVVRIFLTELKKTESALFKDVSLTDFEFHGDASDVLQKILLEALKKASVHQGQGSISVSTLDRETAILLLTCQSLVPEQDSQGTARCGSSDRSFIKEIIAQIVHSYLHLLVNTRSELAFVSIFNIPERGLDREAFTHLKHEAWEKKVSLFQMAQSLITQLRLGGQGYAPSPDSQLLVHVKGLGLLTDFINRLQARIEDTACARSGLVRVIGTIKNSLVNCKSKRYPNDVVKEVTALIESQLEGHVSMMNGQGLLISPDKMAANKGGTLASRRGQRVLLWYLDRCAAAPSSGCSPYLWLQDLPFGSHTPTKFSCSLTYFCSPVLSKVSSPMKKADSKKPARQKKDTNIADPTSEEQGSRLVQERNTRRWLDSVIVLPSKTVAHPAEPTSKEYGQTACRTKHAKYEKGSGVDKENVWSRPSPAEKQAQKKICSSMSPKPSSQSPHLGRVTLGVNNCDNQKQKGSQQTKQSKRCRRRLVPQVKGQQQITNFLHQKLTI